MFSILKNIVVFIGFIATIALGYFLYVQKDSVDDSNLNAQFEITYKADRFVQRLNELKEVELSGDILADARFSSLTSYSAPVQSEPIGRDNPFVINN